MCKAGLHDLSMVGLTIDGRCKACRQAYWREYSHAYELTPRGQWLKHRRDLLRVRHAVDEALASLDPLLKELMSHGCSGQAKDRN